MFIQYVLLLLVQVCSITDKNNPFQSESVFLWARYTDKHTMQAQSYIYGRWSYNISLTCYDLPDEFVRSFILPETKFFISLIYTFLKCESVRTQIFITAIFIEKKITKLVKISHQQPYSQSYLEKFWNFYVTFGLL